MRNPAEATLDGAMYTIYRFSCTRLLMHRLRTHFIAIFEIKDEDVVIGCFLFNDTNRYKQHSIFLDIQ